MCTQLDLDELASYEEVLASLNSVEWMDAIKEEISSMIRKHVQELYDLLLRGKTIGNKCVLKIKCKIDGLIDKYKAPLMARGYNKERV